jgi:hypothetical protein
VDEGGLAVPAFREMKRRHLREQNPKEGPVVHKKGEQQDAEELI